MLNRGDHVKSRVPSITSTGNREKKKAHHTCASTDPTHGDPQRRRRLHSARRLARFMVKERREPEAYLAAEGSNAVAGGGAGGDLREGEAADPT